MPIRRNIHSAPSKVVIWDGQDQDYSARVYVSVLRILSQELSIYVIAPPQTLKELKVNSPSYNQSIPLK